MVVIKLDYEGDIRRVTVENVPTMEELKNLIATLYRETGSTSYSVKYTDDDGDLITVATDREVVEAFRLFEELKTTLRFQIKSTKDLTESAIDRAWTAEEAIHNAECDVCHDRVRGTRWKCKGCSDYDLCNRCYKQEPRPHQQHSFTRIEKRKKIMESSIDASKIQEEEARRAEDERRLQEAQERMTRLRLEEERIEREHREREEREKERQRLEEERLEMERERELREQERERMEGERLEKERMERERMEQERMERERMERERMERMEQERLEKERMERERLENERLEKERSARLEQERLEKERIAQEKEARIQQEIINQERLEREKRANAVDAQMAQYESQLQTLAEMGFSDIPKNIDLLNTHKGDVMAVITTLLM